MTRIRMMNPPFPSILPINSQITSMVSLLVTHKDTKDVWNQSVICNNRKRKKGWATEYSSIFITCKICAIRIKEERINGAHILNVRNRRHTLWDLKISPKNSTCCPIWRLKGKTTVDYFFGLFLRSGPNVWLGKNMWAHIKRRRRKAHIIFTARYLGPNARVKELIEILYLLSHIIPNKISD